MSLHNCQIPVNYDCHICKKSGKLPNILGRFFQIDDTEYVKCNGCNTIFIKVKNYENVISDNIL